MHEGHRRRMMKRLAGDADLLQDHELFEILLFSAVPRRNTNPIAHNLLSAFGSVEGVFHASYEQLLTVDGVGPETASFLKCVAIVYERMRFSNSKFPKSFNYSDFAPFLTERYRNELREILEIFVVDSSEHIISSTHFTSGQFDNVAVNINDFTHFITTHRPHGIIVAHNHPSSSCTNSADDDEFTAKTAIICSVHNVKFFDHMIVGNDGVYSYFLSKHLESIKNKCNVNEILKEK